MKTLVLTVLVLLLSGCGYNRLQGLDEQVQGAWGEVQNQYQRRADLIPNLVATVKGAANFEQETLQRVIEARAAATSVKVDANALNNPETFKKFEQTQNQLTSALSRLLVVVEKYPELKANQNFLELQSALQSIEGDLGNARRYYNATVRDYNTSIQQFPGVLVANAAGFKAREFYELENQAEAQNVEVKF
jgi:LemA protein